MNLLLLLTALLTSLTGLGSGTRVSTAAVAVARADVSAEAVIARVAEARREYRPAQPAARLPLAAAVPPSQAADAALRPVPERRRE